MAPCVSAEGGVERLDQEDGRGEASTILLVIGFVLLTLFYVLTAPDNRTEADDALWYAADVEQTSWRGLFHPFHLVYLPLGRVFWRGLQYVGGPERAYPALILLGALCASAAVIVSWDLLVRRVRMRPMTATFAVGLLAFSYGIWRHAAEAEVYAPAFLGSAVLGHLALAARPGILQRIGVVVAGAIIPLVHILAVIGSVGAAPLAILSRRGWRAAGGYLAATGALGLLLAAGGCLAAGSPVNEMFDFYRSGERVWTIDGPADAARHAVAAGQVVVSGNFVFTYGPVRDALAEGFPGRMLEDEFYAGVRASPAIRWLAPLTAVALVTAGIWFLLSRSRPETSVGRSAARRFAAAWAVLHLVAGVAFSRAGQPEVWMLAVFPAWLLFVTGLVALDERGVALPALAGALLLHNGIGGLAVFANEAGDRHRAKAAWLVTEADTGDVILTAESAGFYRYLAYWASARVVDLQFREPEGVRQSYTSALSAHGRVFATADVFDPPSFYGVLEPELSDSLSSIMQERLGEFEPIRTNEFGGVYVRRADSAGAVD